MIIFLFGTWGAGKSYIGNLIEANCGIPHMEGDLHFTEEMAAAIQNQTFHQLNLDAYYNKVIGEIRSYQRRSPNLVVSQGIYKEKYRRLIYDQFSPDIQFLMVHTPNKWLRNKRLKARVRQGSPVTPKVWEYMARHWDVPNIPYGVILNNSKMELSVKSHLNEIGMCDYWGES